MNSLTILGVVGVELLSTLGIIIVCIFSIVLFFKVWGMCNDVREIKEQLLKSLHEKQSKE